MRTFSRRSLENLSQVHPELVYLMYSCLQETPFDFAIIDGARTREEQIENIRSGASNTARSRHLLQKPKGYSVEFSHAIDFACYVGGKIKWEWDLYEKNWQVIEKIAEELNIKVDWGGNWNSPKDGPHIQLNWVAYPIEGKGL